MQLYIYKKTDELVDELAKWIADYISTTLQKQNRFTIALSGGETPKNLYRTLSGEPYSAKIEWNKMHIFWGDERVVPFTDESNNAKMAYENLLNKVDVPTANIHIMKTDISPGIAAKQYEKRFYLMQTFQSNVCSGQECSKFLISFISRILQS